MPRTPVSRAMSDSAAHYTRKETGESSSTWKTWTRQASYNIRTRAATAEDDFLRVYAQVCSKIDALEPG